MPILQADAVPTCDAGLHAPILAYVCFRTQSFSISYKNLLLVWQVRFDQELAW